MAQFCGETNASETNGVRQMSSTAVKTAILFFPAENIRLWFGSHYCRAILWAETEQRRTRDERIYGGILFSSVALP